MDINSEVFPVIIFFAFIILVILLSKTRKVPRGTVYIVDRNTHYHKTVKHGLFFFNPLTDRITTEISITPKTKHYQNYFETEDGRVCFIMFVVNYSAQNVEDVLYNLSSTRRSIDDVIQGAMYHAVLSLRLLDINVNTLTREYERNISSQVLGLCINIHSFNLKYLDKANYNLKNCKVFKPHKSRSLSESGPFTYSE